MTARPARAAPRQRARARPPAPPGGTLPFEPRVARSAFCGSVPGALCRRTRFGFTAWPRSADAGPRRTLSRWTAGRCSASGRGARRPRPPADGGWATAGSTAAGTARRSPAAGGPDRSWPAPRPALGLALPRQRIVGDGERPDLRAKRLHRPGIDLGGRGRRPAHRPCPTRLRAWPSCAGASARDRPRTARQVRPPSARPSAPSAQLRPERGRGPLPPRHLVRRLLEGQKTPDRRFPSVADFRGRAPRTCGPRFPDRGRVIASAPARPSSCRRLMAARAPAGAVRRPAVRLRVRSAGVVAFHPAPHAGADADRGPGPAPPERPAPAPAPVAPPAPPTARESPAPDWRAGSRGRPHSTVMTFRARTSRLLTSRYRSS